MLTLYTEMTDNLSDDLIIERANMAYEKAVIAYETFMELKKLKIREAELKCVQESGDFDTLVSYYEDVEKETEKKENGLVQNIWAAIKNIIKKIKETLFGKSSKDKLNQAVNDDPDGEIEAPTIFKQAIDALKSGGTNIVKFVGSIPDVIKNNKAWTAAAIVALGSGAGITMAKIKKKDAKAVVDSGEAVLNVAEGIANAASGNGENKDSDKENASMLQKAIGLVRSIIEWLKEKIEAGWDKAKEVAGDLKNKAKDVKDKVTGKDRHEESLNEGNNKAIANLQEEINKKQEELSHIKDAGQRKAIQDKIDELQSKIDGFERQKSSITAASENKDNKNYGKDLKNQKQKIAKELAEYEAAKKAIEENKKGGFIGKFVDTNKNKDIKYYDSRIEKLQKELDDITSNEEGAARYKASRMKEDGETTLKNLVKAINKGRTNAADQHRNTLKKKYGWNDKAIDAGIARLQKAKNTNESAADIFRDITNQIIIERWANDLQTGDVFAESATDALFELAELL